MSREALVFSAAGFCGGILLSRYLPGYFVLFFLLLTVLLLLAGSKFAKIAAVTVLFIALGFLRYGQETPAAPQIKSESKYLSIEGIANSVPVQKNGKQQFFVRIEKVDGKDSEGFLWLAASEKKDIVFGDKVVFQTKLKTPVEKGFRDYLLGRRVRYVCYPEKIISNPSLISLIGNIQLKTKDMFNKSPPEQLLLSSVSGSGTLTEPIKYDFKTSGIVHLMSVSGVHTAALILVCLAAVRLIGLKPKSQLMIITAVIAFNLVFTAFDTSVVRASIVGWLSLYAWYLGRRRDTLYFVLFAFISMLVYDPLYLFDMGFQLTYSCILGILLLSKRFESLFWDLPASFSKPLSVSSAAQFGALPITLFKIGIVPAYSVFANMLAMPLAAPLATLSYLYILLNPIPGSFLFKSAALLFASAIIKISAFFASLPFSRIVITGPYLAAAILLILLVFVFALKKRLSFASAAIFVTVILCLSLSFQSFVGPSEASVTFFDVGQGDSALFESGETSILVDGGPDFETVTDKLIARGVDDIDLVVMSHANADHINGLQSVLKRFKVGAFMEPGGGAPSTVYNELKNEIRLKKIHCIGAKAGRKFVIGDTSVEVLNPQEEPFTGSETDENNNCTVIRVSSGGLSVLFTGDIQEEAELRLTCANTALKSGILKVAHHGSAYSSSEGFLEAVKSGIAVISVGKGNPFGHPSPKAVARLKEEGYKIYRTDKSGDIRVSVSGRRYIIYE